MEDLLYETTGGIAYLTLNRPQARNALTHAMYDGIVDYCAQAAADESVRVMVIQGAGDKAFASGTDISQFVEFTNPQALAAYEKRVARSMEALDGFPKPVIAAVNGACAGGGVGIAAACDIRIGTAAARVGVPIARTLGNCVAPSTIVRLSAIIGQARIIEMIFTAKMYNGAEAKAAGFFNEVFDTKEAMDAHVAALAQTICTMAPLTLRATKEQVRRVRHAITKTLDFHDLAEMCFSSQDFKNAVNAFLNKETHVWQGR